MRRRNNAALRFAAALAFRAGPGLEPLYREEEFLALTGGDTAVFPGRDASREPLVEVADRLETPEDTVLAVHCEVVLVRRGNNLALRAALQWTGTKWAAARAGEKRAGREPLRAPHLP